MDFFHGLIDLFLHLDIHAANLVDDIGVWTYAVVFIVIFLETGVVLTPFLPGDSLLFAVGTLSATTVLNPVHLFLLVTTAAFSGDLVNFWIGSHFGKKIVFSDESRILKKKYLVRTERFYEKYGGVTIIIARFVPVVRTFAPFVAGIAKMNYWRFLFFNVSGGVLWSFLFIFGGYYFGNISSVRENFSIVVIVVIILSILPGVYEYFRRLMIGSDRDI